ncbi:MAG: YfiT family bacillithiol transferase [Terriglobales bacterium]
MSSEEQARYPIGRFQRNPAPLQAEGRGKLIASLAGLPADLRTIIESLSEAQLEQRYRPGGWTVRQLVHHLPDSHLNAYLRIKLALTEDTPTVKTYNEARWAALPDAAATPVAVSLILLAALHARWATLLGRLPEADFQRAFQHPEWGAVTVDDALAQYEWHGRHHLAHIRLALHPSPSG